MERLKERLSLARLALTTLRELVDLEEPSKVERDAAIQRFEYTFEACWRAAQRYLIVIEGLTVGSPKGCIRASREVGLLGDQESGAALVMVDDRNLTVHTYNEKLANRIYGRLGDYTQILDHWLLALERQFQQIRRGGQ